MAGFDFQGARNAGYSDQEIVQHLASDPNVNFDIGGALKSGYSPSEIVSHLSGEKSTGYWDAVKHGTANVLGGVGETLNDYVGHGTGDKLVSAAKEVEPQNYEPAQVVSKDGVSVGSLPRAVVESLPGVAANIAVTQAMPGPAWFKLLAGSGVYALQTLGRKAKARAVNNTGDQNAVPTTGDKIAAAAAEVPEAAIGAYGLGRFLPGAGRVATVGARGVMDAAKQLGKTALIEGGVSGAQNAVSQLGDTVGTNAGASISPADVANAAVVGGATGGALAAPRSAGEAAGAMKYRNFGGDNEAATASVANDIAAKAGGVDKLQPSLFNSQGKAGFDAVSRVDAENRIALKQQVADLENTTPLSPAAKNALTLAASGEPLNKGDTAVIDKAVAGAPNGDLVSFLARKASVLSQLKASGIYDASKGTFTGGMSNRMTHVLNMQNIVKTALATGLGEAAGVHMIAYSPEALGAAALAYGGGRVADRLTGNLSPAWRMAHRFADPSVQPPAVNAPKVTTPPGANGPWGPFPQQTVPNVAQAPVVPSKVPPGFASLLNAQVSQINREGRAQNRQTVSQAMPLIAKLAAQQKPIDLPDNFAATSITNPGASEVVPKPVMTNAKALVKGLMAAQALKQKTLGATQAEAVAAQSPLVESVGGLKTIANPDMGKRMSQIVSAANAYKKLTAQPDEENAQAGTQPGVAQQPGEGVDTSYQIPVSPYAHLPVKDAAAAIAKDAEKAGNVKYLNGFRSATMRNLTAIRASAAGIAKEVPGVDASVIAAQFEGAASRKAAIAHREWLKSQVPQASDALNTYFSDEVINRIWKRKG